MSASLSLRSFFCASARANQRRVPAVVPVVTEEGQAVVFAKRNWQMRGLAKQLPLDEPWPMDAEVKLLQRYGLDRTTLSDTIPKAAKSYTSETMFSM